MQNFIKSVLVIFILGLTNSLLAAYQVQTPRTEGYLQVSQKHQIFYAAYGNPEGIPVVVLHGGPGMGTTNEYTRFFDLAEWNVVMFDQRGAMRSIPFACMEENTTQDSIEDIETLRNQLGIQQWVVFGHSWGSCLGLAYGETYPKSCLGFILEGVFLGREQDISFFRDMGKGSISAYEDFLTNIPLEEQNDIPKACYQRLMDPNPEVHMNMARALMRYQLLNSSKPQSPEVIKKVLSDERFILSFIRSFVHYAYNKCFLQPNQIIADINKVVHFPAIIVHGSLDVVCPPEQAYLLHDNWSNSQLWIIEGAGHSCSEPAIAHALTQATDSFILNMD
jgi:proline iminopeptidase